MGCISKHYLSESTILGVWKIEEDLGSLLELVVLDGEDKKKYKDFSSTSRKLEFLSVRALLSELIGKDARIVYNKNNKPFLKDGSRFISISHSHKLTAILLSTNEKVGIDLEYMSTNISAIAFKFINRKEKITKGENRKFHLYLHWCAKEALYKICDKEGISFKKNLTIDPFVVGDSGEIKGKVNTDKINNESFDLFYTRYDNYAIVWAKKNYDKG